MTERTLYRRTLVVLGLTILPPLVVAASGLGLGAKGTKLDTRLTDYIHGVAATGVVATKDTVSTQKAPATADKTTPAAPAQNSANQKVKSTAQNTMLPNTAAKGVAAAAKSAGTYTVKNGDTYGCIAEHYYGSYDQWPRVYEANGGYVGYEEYSLAVGARLQLPAITTDQVLPSTDLCK